MLIAICAFAPADTITGLVVGISDSDTITVASPEKVRLAGIDASEKSQSFG